MSALAVPDRTGPGLRILCTTQPGAGHLLPMVDLLTALTARGHQVLVASSPSMAGLCRRFGLRLHPVGPDFVVGDEPRLVPALAAARAGGDRDFRYTRTVLVEALGQAALADTQALVERWRPDLVVRDPVEFAGLAAAEAAGLPHVTGRENRFLAPEVWADELGDSLAELGRAAGIADLGVDALYRHLGLAPALPAFVTAAPVLPDAREFGDYLAPTVRFIRPRTPSAPGSAPTSCEKSSRAGVVITLGTVPGHHASLRSHVAEAAVRLRLPLYGDVPGARGEGWLDLNAVLPHCAVLVTVGGFGTVSAALRHGVPMVVLPVAADQPTNAARCAALGVGRVLAPAAVSADSLCAAVYDVMHEPSYAERAAELAAQWHELPDREWAAAQVEAVAAGAGR